MAKGLGRKQIGDQLQLKVTEFVYKLNKNLSFLSWVNKRLDVSLADSDTKQEKYVRGTFFLVESPLR